MTICDDDWIFEYIRNTKKSDICGTADPRHELILKNRDLAIKWAFKFRWIGIPLNDLLQAANTGLTLASDKFKPEKGSFRSCAFYCIMSEIYKLIVASEHIRIPTHIFWELIKREKQRAKKRLLTT